MKQMTCNERKAGEKKKKTSFLLYITDSEMKLNVNVNVNKMKCR